jgi:ABC-type glutathione transport system ATPase component
MPPVIDVRGLVERFGELVAVDGVSLAVEPGERFGFFGPKGAGKSTTIKKVSSGAAVTLVGARSPSRSRRSRTCTSAWSRARRWSACCPCGRSRSPRSAW